MPLGLFKSKKKENDLLNKDYLPTHVAIIMDGNGRWAKNRMMPRLMGHKEGVETLRNIIKYSSGIGIGHLTFYAFSTENWKRPKEEVNGLMDLLVAYLRSELVELNRNNVKMNFIGFLDALPELPRQEIIHAMEMTKNNKGLQVNIAVNYGSRDEIMDAIRQIAMKVSEGKMSAFDISEEVFVNHLQTAGIPDPDLMIRTSGEERLSNFLLWQLAYSEFYFTEILWPDFNPVEFEKALIAYQKRHRRFGGI